MMPISNKKYRIGIICYPTYGGSGVVATELGMALAAQQHKVHFISYIQPFRLNAFSENIFFHEVAVADYPLFDFIPYEHNLTAKLVDVVLHEHLDILHVHYAIPHAFAAVSAKNILKTKGVNIPVVTTLHGTDITLFGNDASFKPVIEYAINNSDAITAVSESLRLDTLQKFQINKEIEVIPNFIDVKKYQNRNKSLRKGFAMQHEKIIIHISNFRKVKRTADVLKIFEQIVKRVPSKLLLVGDGPERQELEQMCRKLGLCSHISFLGKLAEVEKILSVADLFLLPSETESFGLVALEAMAAGVPVISSDSGGLPEINLNGKTGFLLPVGDVEGMAKKSIALLLDEKKLLQFKQNASERAMQYDLPNILPNYKKIYKSFS